MTYGIKQIPLGKLSPQMGKNIQKSGIDAITLPTVAPKYKDKILKKIIKTYLHLKGYLSILTTSFHGMNQKIFI